jgi:V8-like Glu-specific endopeptidase
LLVQPLLGDNFMRHLALGCGALALGACVVEPDTRSVEQSIIGGQQANISEFPSLASIEAGPGQPYCAGVLIDKDWVLTTAGCMLGESPSTVKLRFDDNTVMDGNGGRVVQISQIQRKPGYDKNAWGNDVALMKLNQSVTDRPPVPILRSAVPANTMTTQAAWGDTDNNIYNGIGGNLHKLITPSEDCNATIGFSNTDYVCFNAADGNGTCWGDGGAPAYTTINGRLRVAGVASGGTNESCALGYNVFSSMQGSNLAFIDQFVPKVEDPVDPTPDPDPDPDPNPDPNPDPLDPKPPTRDPNGGGFNQGGCNTGGAGAGWLLALGVGVAFVQTRRRRRA